MAATYSDPWRDPTTSDGIRDEIRWLMQDNVTSGSTAVSNAVLTDTEYDAAIANFGQQRGAAQIARAYASFYNKKIIGLQQASGERFQWMDRAKFYTTLANDIITGLVVIGQSGDRAVMRGGTVLNPDTGAYLQQYGVFPRPGGLVGC